MKLLKTNKGFTLIELAVVAAILVILAVVAMSSFTSQNQILESATGSIRQIGGAINAGLRAELADAISQGNTNHQFDVLDHASNAQASTSNALFGNYIDPPVTWGLWKKHSDWCYGIDGNQDGEWNASDETDTCLVFDNSTGKVGAWYTGHSVDCSSHCHNEENPW